MTTKRPRTTDADPTVLDAADGTPETGSVTEPEHPLTEAGQDAAQTAGRVAERAGDLGFERADQAREVTANGLDRLASTVRRVSADLETDQPMIADVATTAAEQTERVASFLRETDAREIVHNVEDVARRQPLLFVGGAFLLGLAASRFIKAAGGRTSPAVTGNGFRRHGGTSQDYRAYGPVGETPVGVGERIRP